MKRTWNNTFHIKPLINREKSIVGVLNPVHWDKNGKVKQFAIYADNEEDIIIEGCRNKRKLGALLNKRVLARGSVRTDEDGERYIFLKSIKELTDPVAPAIRLARPTGSSFWDEEYSLSIPKEYASAQYNQMGESYWGAC